MKVFLCCLVQSTGVADFLDTSQYNTLFVPDDNAFNHFFKELVVVRGFNTSYAGSVEELPLDILKMVG